MTVRSPGAFLLSALLHGALVALVLFFAYALQPRQPETTKVFQLVAGEGDNFAATDAPALGEEGGVKLTVNIPEPVPQRPTPIVETAPPEPTPAPQPEPQPAPATVIPTPAEKAPVKPVETKAPNFAKDVKRIADKRAKRLETKYRHEREAAEKKAKAEEAARQKQMTKAEFDKLHGTKTTATKAGPAPKVAKIDAEGIRSGVLGGSTSNKTGGAGGRALHRDDGDDLDMYYALLKSRAHDALEKPPGLSDTLVTEVTFNMSPSGTISGARVTQTSGSPEFDAAALAAINRVRMPNRPDRKSENGLSLLFRMRDPVDNG
ncbi:cell envelope integrity protein TolA [Horticoccus luteus]|uniref:Cell envelope integrity protein TolA n=1 Tax=Horticoccus luteus TaxID=2862869 RepID=A0A8F9XIM6_9BACT|nr:cell envelope integrity protein TolA [Horticoccus luteus]QYM77753.1 cell envelope integrity protein TolA [Horticoccus luteus]